MEPQLEPGLPLSVPDAIRRRRSIRTFHPDPVPPDLLLELLELTVSAPSSWNLQPWQIVVVQDEAQRLALQRSSYGQRQVGEAPVTLVFAVSNGIWRRNIEPMVSQAEALGAWSAEYCAGVRQRAPQQQENLERRGQMREFNVRDAVVAATQAMLAAESLGLATCMMSGWQEEMVKEVIGAGGNEDIGIAILLDVGYPAETPASPGRLAHNVFLGRLGTSYPEWNGR
ncbi:MAG: nitroreductase family protein [Thermoanaerobaculia bacterium]